MNLEVKPSFFSVAGFLAPGLFTLAVFGATWGAANPNKLEAAYNSIKGQNVEGAAGVFLGAAALITLLAVGFVLGSFLSEAANFIGRKLILRWTAGSRLELINYALGQSVPDQLKLSLNHREAFVYIQTCGLDLHWYAGRNRMLMGSALGLLIVAGYAANTLPCPTAIWLAVAGVLIGAVGVYRSYKFDDYVAAAAAILQALGPRAPAQSADE